MSIVLLHGKGSNPEKSRTCKFLQEKLRDYFPVCIEYPTHESKDSLVKYFDDYPINWGDVDCVIGISLGGYWARHLGLKYKINITMINPSLDFYKDDRLYDVKSNIPTLLIINEDDEILDARKTVNKYSGHARMVISETGGHRCQNLEKYVEEIEFNINNKCD